MKVCLMQHARAVDLEDGSDRVVSEAGRVATKQVARFVAEHLDVNVSRIYHSGKTRARQTAELFAQEAAPTAELEAVDGLAPMDDPAIWTQRICDMHTDVMLVGHLPHMDRLTSILVTGDAGAGVVAVRNSGLMCLEAVEDGWRLCWMLIPGVLR